MKKRRPSVLSNISIVAISVGWPVAVNNPVPTSQVRFQKFRAIQRFWVESSNTAEMSTDQDWIGLDQD